MAGGADDVAGVELGGEVVGIVLGEAAGEQRGIVMEDGGAEGGQGGAELGGEGEVMVFDGLGAELEEEVDALFHGEIEGDGGEVAFVAFGGGGEDGGAVVEVGPIAPGVVAAPADDVGFDAVAGVFIDIDEAGAGGAEEPFIAVDGEDIDPE